MKKPCIFGAQRVANCNPSSQPKSGELPVLCASPLTTNGTVDGAAHLVVEQVRRLVRHGPVEQRRLAARAVQRERLHVVLERGRVGGLVDGLVRPLAVAARCGRERVGYMMLKA